MRLFFRRKGGGLLLVFMVLTAGAPFLYAEDPGEAAYVSDDDKIQSLSGCLLRVCFFLCRSLH